MSRKHPKARRATALTLLTSMLLVLAAATAVALHPSPAQAGSDSTPPIVSARKPLPGDPNTPDEGGSKSTVLTFAGASPVRSWVAWVKEFVAHFHLQPR